MRSFPKVKRNNKTTNAPFHFAKAYKNWHPTEKATKTWHLFKKKKVDLQANQNNKFLHLVCSSHFAG